MERGARAARGGDRDRADRRGRRRRPPGHVGDQPRRGADLPAGPGATRISRWRRAWRTRSSHGCRAPRSEAPSAPTRSRKRDRIAGARSGAEGAPGETAVGAARGPMRPARLDGGPVNKPSRGGAMKRTPLRRRAPLRAGRPLRRKTPLRRTRRWRRATRSAPRSRDGPASSAGPSIASTRPTWCQSRWALWVPGRAHPPVPPAPPRLRRRRARPAPVPGAGLRRAQVAHAVGHVGLIGALRRISGNHRDSKPGALP